MKVALVYDRINKWGGAERILLCLHKLFPEAPIFTSVYDRTHAPWAEDINIIPSFLQRINFFRTRHEFLSPLMPIVFESFDFKEFDLVISVTSESAKGIIVHPGTRHICICLTPTRYLWSGYKDYFKNPIFKFVSNPIISYLRFWDRICSSRPDHFVAISQTVQNRILKYYDKPSDVIYPPILLQLEILLDNVSQNPESKPYYLVVSRLSRHTAYKRVDLAIRAAKRAGVNLVVIGEGKDQKYFEGMGGKSVKFLGKVNDATLAQYYQHAQALIFPGKEDFGLVMAEANRAGTPVIAYKAGGAKEIVIDGKTGEFFEKQTIEALSNVLISFKKIRYNASTCVKNGRRFSQILFEKQLMGYINKV